MKLPIALPLTLLVASAAFACSSSGSSASPGGSDDASTPDDATTPTAPDSSLPNTGDDASEPQDSSNPGDSSQGSIDAGTLSFSADIYGPIIEHHCVGCHGPTADGGPGSGIAFGKLDMSSADAGYANLVNVAAAGAACELIDGSAGPIRVVPGSAASSLLYDKVNGFADAPPICGSAMPKSGEIPDGGQAIVVAQIQAWINQGALP